MLTIDPKRSLLLVVDFQSRLMPAIHEGEAAIRNAHRLIEVAKMVDVPRLFTEQNAKGLGPTAQELSVEEDRLVDKQFFDACRERGFLDRVPADGHIVVVGARPMSVSSRPCSG